MQMQRASVSSSSTRAASRPCVASLRPVAPRGNCFQAAPTARVQAQRVIAKAAAKVADEEKLKLTGDDYDQEVLKLPAGYHWYETMMILKPTLSDEERDKELAKFEAFLNKEECMNINALVRGRSRMAYPIKTNWEGIYVLYTYAAKRQTARTIQLLLSNPEAGSEDVLLRHITLLKY
mmetsp:Transcript_5403/g.11914  ORF Transcript_5403/g.11914 Transcript_5403/m.11914 type:complete len:178 (+) Transcript_5403:113-646(+)|eukprot:CAMPEP_0202901408 /NCGR_PEP_ID=MMETSP1392-20130828/14235_1 /ASSEMBLY_ACC=CAM_ASM_000868 /TAXON_ID=225041 /ORGANISM="Chlamydomonas chlamydogama, Strain SAG 11-48b" /LENGTH=177 /DNA_ID=CAMNT_0049587965 /DNA_START=93 /DNA_END=626 /DNA_ORIENTATION=-